MHNDCWYNKFSVRNSLRLISWESPIMSRALRFIGLQRIYLIIKFHMQWFLILMKSKLWMSYSLSTKGQYFYLSHLQSNMHQIIIKFYRCPILKIIFFDVSCSKSLSHHWKSCFLKKSKRMTSFPCFQNFNNSHFLESSYTLAGLQSHFQ